MNKTGMCNLLILACMIFLTSNLYAADFLGIWGCKYGDIRIEQNGDNLTGTLMNTSSFCPFKNGDVLLKGTAQEDQFVGHFKMCQADDECGPPVDADVLLLLSEDGQILSGSAVVKKSTCPVVGFSKTPSGERGLYFKKKTESEATKAKTVATAKPEKKAPAAKPQNIILPGPPSAEGTYDPRSILKPTPTQDNHLLNGKRLMEAGQFEKARAEFKKVLKEDSGNPTALTGIGATYYARQDFNKAMRYYKKAISSDPNFGMAYYNMACLYALSKKPDKAMDYLKIAFLNGFVVLKTMQQDPDLDSLRNRADYAELIKGDF